MHSRSPSPDGGNDNGADRVSQGRRCLDDDRRPGFHLPAEGPSAAGWRGSDHWPDPRRRDPACRHERPAARAGARRYVAAAPHLRQPRPDRRDLHRRRPPARRRRRTGPFHPADRRDPGFRAVRPARRGRDRRRCRHQARRAAAGRLGGLRAGGVARPGPVEPRSGDRALGPVPGALPGGPAGRAAGRPARAKAGRPRHRGRGHAAQSAQPDRGRPRR